MVSFYTLNSSILGHAEHTLLKAAYMYYTGKQEIGEKMSGGCPPPSQTYLMFACGFVVPGVNSIKQLINDAMILAAKKGYDVFNALDLLENQSYLKDLKFGIGDGSLHYYLFNWRVTVALNPQEVGLILM
jgi:glycylpeptide N-tetradecanoyltransferase